MGVHITNSIFRSKSGDIRVEGLWYSTACWLSISVQQIWLLSCKGYLPFLLKESGFCSGIYPFISPVPVFRSKFSLFLANYDNSILIANVWFRGRNHLLGSPLAGELLRKVALMIKRDSFWKKTVLFLLSTCCPEL